MKSGIGKKMLINHWPNSFLLANLMGKLVTRTSDKCFNMKANIILKLKLFRAKGGIIFIALRFRHPV